MLRLILMDELHVRVAVAATATAADRTAIRRLLAGPSFRRRCQRAFG